MTSPYIRLSKAAIKAKLKQNEGLIFHALMIQTLGYRKSVDNLTDKRLAQLTGIRLDHLRPALDTFLDHNLFYRVEHRDYDYQYRICDEFLDEAQSTIVYPPSLPKIGQAQDLQANSPNSGEATSPTLGNVPEVGVTFPPTSGNLTEHGGHTTENLNIKKPPPPKNTTENKQPQTETKKTNLKKQPQTNTKEIDFRKQQQPSVTISMAGLETMPEEFIIESSEPIRIAFSSHRIGTVAKATDHAENTINAEENVPIATTEKTALPIAEPITPTPAMATSMPKPEPSIEPIKPVMPTAPAIPKAVTKPMPSTTAKTFATLAESVLPTLTATTQDSVVVVDEDEKEQKPFAIPKAVGEMNIKACRNHLQTLTRQQQKDVIKVFYAMLKTGTIRNKANYFIGLTRTAKEGGLTLPDASVGKPATGGGFTNTHAYTRVLTPEEMAKHKEADKARHAHASLWADYQWVKRHAARLNQSEEEAAKSMGLEEGYTLFASQEEAQVA